MRKSTPPAVKSLAGEPCRVQCSFSGPLRCHGPASASLRQSGDTIALDLKANEEALLYYGDALPSWTIAPLHVDPEERNAWGVQKNVQGSLMSAKPPP
jgi:hypothetical protein